MSNQLPPLLHNSASTDIVGFVVTVVIPGLMLLLVSSEKARQAAQAILNAYNVYRGFRERMQPKPPTPAATNGNGNGHTNGNGQSDLLKSVLNNLRVEADAREAGDSTLEQKYLQLMERGRRESDSFFTALTDLHNNDKTIHITLGQHGAEINNLKAETIALRADMVKLFKNDDDMNRKLDVILHLLDPNQPPPPGAKILDLASDESKATADYPTSDEKKDAAA